MQTSQSFSPASSAISAPPARLRLDYLDSVRALAAIYVCLFHTVVLVIWPHYPNLLFQDFGDLPPLTAWTIGFLRGGHFAVSIFIVLSGYCLMLPVARQSSGRLPGGVTAFLWRRARRVLPPYYAALALSILLTSLVPDMQGPKGGFWNVALPIWDRGTLVSHVLLVQNWSMNWFFKIDPAVWSMATESQIYLIFAFVLLPLTRGLGVAPTTVIALWAGLEVHWYFNAANDFIYWSYIGLFALGMLGAVIGFSPERWAKFSREKLPWGALAFLAWALMIRVCLSPGQAWMQTHLWLVDPLIGSATVLLLIFCTQALSSTPAGPLPLILRVLQARPLVQLGGFSYSLYLVHFPVLVILGLLVQPLGLSLPAVLCLMLVLCLPVCARTAYWFHLVFERPFMPGQPTNAAQAARAAVLSPAP